MENAEENSLLYIRRLSTTDKEKLKNFFQKLHPVSPEHIITTINLATITQNERNLHDLIEELTANSEKTFSLIAFINNTVVGVIQIKEVEENIGIARFTISYPQFLTQILENIIEELIRTAYVKQLHIILLKSQKKLSILEQFGFKDLSKEPLADIRINLGEKNFIYALELI